MSNTFVRHYGYVPEKQLSLSTFNTSYGKFNTGSRYDSYIDGWRSTEYGGKVETKSYYDYTGGNSVDSNGSKYGRYVELNTAIASSYRNYDTPGITQTFKTEAGLKHTINFDYTGRYGYDQYTNSINIFVDGKYKGRWDDDARYANRLSGLEWKDGSVSFVADSDGYSTIEFRETGRDNLYGRGMFIDNIELVRDAQYVGNPQPVVIEGGPTIRPATFTNTEVDVNKSPIINGTGNSVDNSETNEVTFTLNSNNTTNSNNTIDNSVTNTTTQTFTINLTGDNNSIGSFGNTSFEKVGTAGNDILKSQASTVTNDLFRGGAGNDELTGYRGKDVLLGDAGNDILRAGNGRDIISGGNGSDTLFGGFGQNVFTGEKDGSVDRLFFKSDQFAYNWIYEKAGNQDGQKVDMIGALDAFDRIHIQGVETSDLTFKATDTNIQGNSVSGIGIFAGGTLEAVYTGGDLNQAQLQSMTVGVDI